MHIEFAWHHTSRMKQDLRYAPSDVVETFPFPEIQDQEREVLHRISKELWELKTSAMTSRIIGLTELLKLISDRNLGDHDITSIRDKTIKLDQLVVDAYHWNDLRLDHDFRPVDYLPENDNVRFTISDELRREVLYRLALLNKERWLAEGNEDDGF